MATLRYAPILRLITRRRERRPAQEFPALDALFQRLAASPAAEEAVRTEERIWALWMYHPHRSVAEQLELASCDIAARRYDIAETRLVTLLRRRPDFAEAWQKRCTLYYLTGRDDECLDDVARTLELEPRHFGAMLNFAEILLGAGEEAPARLAFSAALSLHPHLSRARQVLTATGPEPKSASSDRF